MGNTTISSTHLIVVYNIKLNKVHSYHDSWKSACDLAYNNKNLTVTLFEAVL